MKRRTCSNKDVMVVVETIIMKIPSAPQNQRKRKCKRICLRIRRRLVCKRKRYRIYKRRKQVCRRACPCRRPHRTLILPPAPVPCRSLQPSIGPLVPYDPPGPPIPVPFVPIIPSPPPPPPPPPIPPPMPREACSNVWDKDCCGNFLVQGNQEGNIILWEIGANMRVFLAQISIYSSPASNELLNVTISGPEQTHLLVYPGNTVNFTGRNIHSVMISAKASTSTYVDGKYSVSSSFDVQ